ncbi:hypothetical protein CC2G_012311 [Coprinopsis cinerea AmutBmut pab1-1]|nr:hypothetical protein CC2G_012311 [Coprinopsis cinerea AmutBmut pab1-1]
MFARLPTLIFLLSASQQCYAQVYYRRRRNPVGRIIAGVVVGVVVLLLLLSLMFLRRRRLRAARYTIATLPQHGNLRPSNAPGFAGFGPGAGPMMMGQTGHGGAMPPYRGNSYTGSPPDAFGGENKFGNYAPAPPPYSNAKEGQYAPPPGPPPQNSSQVRGW